MGYPQFDGNKLYRGRIKSYNQKTGYGFIQCHETWNLFGQDIFLHKSQKGELKVDSNVQFRVSWGTGNAANKGPQAKDVAPAKEKGKKGRGKGKGDNAEEKKEGDSSPKE